MILHHFQTSLSSDNAFTAALPLIADEDCLLLSSEALYGLLNPAVQTQLAQYTVYVLDQDCEALGLAAKLAGYPTLDYAEFVQLTLKSDKVISW
ncbi:sulfurtransferase complex subunit TusB [Shewanella avicenniae]|uniref:Sulfurtransferase complex subunit TusB n=1 Tax=Shewanella avicenniae TaxID=2814294 RepID=A0ABX7QUV7_9GAMM|nr:sulfurtransferase complex subunit TusB [Shewanella avicenniae]QSX35282.1 sulfurtransferase complex subunit TusB [Shewanella avicenniae]